MFSIYDVKAEIYNKPFPLINKDVALRGFSEYIQNGDINDDIVKYPADFILHEIGTYDDSTGLLTPHNAPIYIGRGSEIIKGAQNVSTDKSLTQS